MKRRKRLDDGTFGPLEEVFPEEVDEMHILMMEAMSGMQEQIMMLEAEIATLKGSAAK